MNVQSTFIWANCLLPNSPRYTVWERPRETWRWSLLGVKGLIHHCIQFRARIKWPKGREYYNNTIIIRLAQYRSVSRKIKFDPASRNMEYKDVSLKYNVENDWNNTKQKASPKQNERSFTVTNIRQLPSHDYLRTLLRISKALILSQRQENVGLLPGSWLQQSVMTL